jgi:hypothetical protein
MTRTASATAAVVPRAVVTAALGTLTLLAPLTACSKEPAGPSAPASSAPSSAPPASPSANAEEAEAQTKAVEAYINLRKAQVAASAKADTSGGDLPKYAADPLLSELRYDLQIKKEQGLVTKGAPKWSVQVTKVNVASRPFAVELEDCFDSTDWQIVFKDTGKSAAVPGQATKYLVRAEATQYDDGRWLIKSAKADRDRPC